MLDSSSHQKHGFGREATAGDFSSPAVVNALADALHWLACRLLIYIDVREPNVLIDDDAGRAYRVDYDDVAVVETAPTSFDEFSALVKSKLPREHVEFLGTFVDRFEALAAAVRAKWS